MGGVGKGGKRKNGRNREKMEKKIGEYGENWEILGEVGKNNGEKLGEMGKCWEKWGKGGK